MSVLSDKQIFSRCEGHPSAIKNPMIYPFSPCQIKKHDKTPVVSYGLSSYGYDIKLGDKFKVFTNVHSCIIDPKKFDEDLLVDVTVPPGGALVIPPNSFALGESYETLNIPRDILAICVGKSTYARCGLIVNVTPLEPEWRGKITIEMSNTAPSPSKVWPLEGIMQVIFYKVDEICLTSYADKKGKYQDQEGLVTAKV